MCQTPHILVAAAIGIMTRNPYYAFIAGFISHLVLDSIPHYDLESHFRASSHKIVVALAVSDFEFGFLVLFLFLYHRPSSIRKLAYIGAFGGVILDLIDEVAVRYVWPGIRATKVGRALHYLHKKFHSHEYREYWYFGIATQVGSFLGGLATIYCI